MKTCCTKTPKTGWPPGLLQDDDKRFSKWLAQRGCARKLAEEAALQILRKKDDELS